jgi:hypothetical protein
MLDAGTPNHSIRLAVQTDAPELARLVTALGHPTTPTEVAARWIGWTAAGNGAVVAVVRDAGTECGNSTWPERAR